MAGAKGDDTKRPPAQQEEQEQAAMAASAETAAAAAAGEGEGGLVVGYAFLAKKMGTMGKIVMQEQGLEQEEARSSIRFCPIDLDRPMEDQVGR